MNEEKCFCHLNGFAVKDATARQEIELLKQGGSGGKTYYRHLIRVDVSDDPYTVSFVFISSSPTPVTNVDELNQLIRVGDNEYGYPLVGIGDMTKYICSYANYAIRSADGGGDVFFEVNGTDFVSDIVHEL